VDTEDTGRAELLIIELERDLGETARALFAAGSVAATLQRIVEVAVETIDGCDHAGLFVVEDEAVTTPASTDDLVEKLHALQFETDEGPCLDAVSEADTYYAEDLADEDRWPAFATGAVAAGIRSVLAFRMRSNGTLVALNLYAELPRAFGATDRAKGLIFATLASSALGSAHARAEDADRVEGMQRALVTHEVIGQAQGILMERERISAVQAFDMLRRASQHLNVKLRDAAQALIDTGQTPAAPSGPKSAPDVAR
jgi:GAF domain-containing protein